MYTTLTLIFGDWCNVFRFDDKQIIGSHLPIYNLKKICTIMRKRQDVGVSPLRTLS